MGSFPPVLSLIGICFTGLLGHEAESFKTLLFTPRLWRDVARTLVFYVGGRNDQVGNRVGQTIAVVFSDELAAAQSRYLNAFAHLDEHHKHHVRTIRLVEIRAAS